MSTGEQDLERDPNLADDDGADPTATATDDDAPAKHRMDLDVKISDVGPCKKHLKVTIPRAEIDRQFEESLGSIRKDAFVPGFRPGKAPKQLVEKRFRKDLAGQVKSTLLMSCLEQLDEGYDLKPITTPQLDLEAIDLPESGPLHFELDIEVAPEVTLPDYKGLKVKRPAKTIAETDIDAQYKAFLERYARIVPKTEGTAELGDYVVVNIRFLNPDGTVGNEAKDLQFRIQPELRFQDGSIPKLAEALVGAKPGDKRTAEALVGSSALDPNLRGRTLQAEFDVLDLKTVRLPEVNQDFLYSIGYESEAELRQAVKDALERRAEYQQQEALRRDVLDQLLGQTSFELPKDLVEREERNQLRRRVQAMRQGGLTDVQIRAREAELRANAHEASLRSLQEWFILSKIAEVEKIEVGDEDMENEIERIADQSDESPRRVRSRMEKDGQLDILNIQILERKALDHILGFVEFEEVAAEKETSVETIDQSASLAVSESEETPSETEGEPKTDEPS